MALFAGQARSLGADAGLLAVLALAIRQGMLQIAGIRRAHVEDGGRLTPELVLAAARERFTGSLAASGVIAAALLPFIVMGDVAGNEITHTAADVMLGGLATAAILTQILVPALYLALGPTEPIETEPVEEAAESEPVHAWFASAS